MDIKAGHWVEHRYGFGPCKVGRVQARCREGYDVFYVTVDVGMTHIVQGRDVRHVPAPVPLPDWAEGFGDRTNAHQ